MSDITLTQSVFVYFPRLNRYVWSCLGAWERPQLRSSLPSSKTASSPPASSSPASRRYHLNPLTFPSSLSHFSISTYHVFSIVVYNTSPVMAEKTQLHQKLKPELIGIAKKTGLQTYAPHPTTRVALSQTMADTCTGRTSKISKRQTLSPLSTDT